MTREAIVVPELGETASASVARWERAAGEAVRAGDLVVELEADKATFEVTATVDGMLVERAVELGTVVRPGDVLGTIEVGAAGVQPAARVEARSHPPAGEPVWEVRIVEIPFGVERVELEPGWEPFGIVDGRRIATRRRR